MLEFFSITVSNRQEKKKPCVHGSDNRKNKTKKKEAVLFICKELSVSVWLYMHDKHREKKKKKYIPAKKRTN